MDWLTMSLGVLSGGLAGALTDYIAHARQQRKHRDAQETQQFITAKTTWERSAEEDWDKLWREHMSGVLKTDGGNEWWKGVQAHFDGKNAVDRKAQAPSDMNDQQDGSKNKGTRFPKDRRSPLQI